VRADAEIDERIAILDRVDRHLFLAGRLLFDELHLQRLAALAEKGDGFVPRPHLTLVHEIALGNLAHALLDLLEVFRHERPIDDEVVEEAFVSGRTDAALHVRKELRDRGGEQVSGAVPIHRERFRIFRGQDPHSGIFVERI
jgi:hypothetical protein